MKINLRFALRVVPGKVCCTADGSCRNLAPFRKHQLRAPDHAKLI